MALDFTDSNDTPFALAATALGATLRTHREGAVLVFTLSNPVARNAMNPAIYRAAAQAIRATAGFRTVRAIVLRGEGAHFSGGGDLKRLARQRKLPASEQQGHLDALHEWIMALQEAPQPVIAAVEGAAMGGGFSLCLACDLIVAAEDAQFAMSYVNVGLSPDGGATDSLARALPPQAALEMLLDGTPVSAARLQGWGVVNKVVPHGAGGTGGTSEPAACVARLGRVPEIRSTTSVTGATGAGNTLGTIGAGAGAGTGGFLPMVGRARITLGLAAGAGLVSSINETAGLGGSGAGAGTTGATGVGSGAALAEAARELTAPVRPAAPPAAGRLPDESLEEARGLGMLEIRKKLEKFAGSNRLGRSWRQGSAVGWLARPGLFVDRRGLF